MMKTYSELITITDFMERFRYLKLQGKIGYQTFGGNRYLNQIFYNSYDWKKTAREIILRDEGYDLGFVGKKIGGTIYVHHIEPITVEDLLNNSPKLLDPDNLISASELTHKALHFSNEDVLPKEYVPRTPYDTAPWRL